MKKATLLGFFFILLILLIILRINSHTIVAVPTPQAYDLSDSELQHLEQRALQDGDLKSAARVYWYFKFSKSDDIEASKWEDVVRRLDKDADATNNDAPTDRHDTSENPK